MPFPVPVPALHSLESAVAADEVVLAVRLCAVLVPLPQRAEPLRTRATRVAHLVDGAHVALQTALVQERPAAPRLASDRDVRQTGRRPGPGQHSTPAARDLDTSLSFFISKVIPLNIGPSGSVCKHYTGDINTN